MLNASHRFSSVRNIGDFLGKFFPPFLGSPGARVKNNRLARRILMVFPGRTFAFRVIGVRLCFSKAGCKSEQKIRVDPWVLARDPLNGLALDVRHPTG